MKKVPKSILQTLRAKYPKGEFSAAIKVSEETETYYVVTVKNDEQILRVSLTSRGKIKETQRKVEIVELPKIVSLAVKKNYPGAMLEAAKETVAETGKTTKKTFTVWLTTGAKKKLEVSFDGHGSVLEEKEVKEARAVKK
jgi:hypothetical protein